jgi:anti-sigma-K factor RskA
MTADIHTLTGAYAVNALSDSEFVLFEQHLERCEACRQEVRELRETTALLAAGVAQAPSAGLRTRVLDEIATTRQLPPNVPAPFGTAPPSRSAWFPRALLGVAAGLLALVVALGVVTVRLQQSADESRRTAEAVAEVLAAPDAKQVVGAIGTGTGRLVVSRSEGKAVFVASGVPAAGPRRDYQLWVMSPGSARSAGLLDRRPGGRTEPIVVTLTPGAEQIGLTKEPAGGSPQPTTDPLMRLELPAA